MNGEFMKKIHTTGLALFGLIACGCVTTSNNSPTPSPAKIADGEFVEMYGGLGEVHKYSGLQCDNQIADMRFDKSHIYQDNGEDISCGWREGTDRRYVTIYATRYQGKTFKDLWQDTINTINIVESKRGLSLDQDKSSACTLSALVNVAAALAKGEAKSSRSFSLETAVFTSDTITSVVTLHPAAGGWMLKVRSTYPAHAGKDDESKYVQMCSEASEITQKQSAYISGAGWK